jgi:enterobactin synthetase component D
MEVPAPIVLPPFVVSHAATLMEGTHRDYRPAGRSCASEAIRRLTGLAGATIGTGDGGEPLWPEGTTGSITHKNGFVWAAVARLQNAAGLGIDVEQIVEPARAERMSRLVLLPEERNVGTDTLDPALRFTLIFSIKEAIFKCLYPIVRKRFYYEAFVVTAIDRKTGCFTGRLTMDLGERLPCGWTTSGRFAVDRQSVFTAVLLTPAVTAAGATSSPRG